MDDLQSRGVMAARTEAIARDTSVLRLRDVHHRFGNVQALDGVSLEVQPGEILGIIGRSGAGKSTLIRCLNGLERPTSGAIFVEQSDITRLDEVGLQKMRRRVGMVFQHFNLLAAKTAGANIAIPLEIAGWSRPRRKQRVAELLDLVGLSDKGGSYPAQLSGGQKQRVGIARALAASPALLLCDEATSALDPETTHSILDLLGDINRRLGLTIVLVTHEMSVIRSLAHRVVVMNQGRIVERGTISEIFSRPREEVTRSLLQSVRPRLPRSLAAALRPAHQPGDLQVLCLELDGRGARAPLLSDLGKLFDTRAFLLHGGVDDVQGQPVGTLFVGIAEENTERRVAAVRFLLERAVHGEELGYVPAIA